MNLSHHRLTDLSELEPYKASMGWDAFYLYAIGVYKQLVDLEVGQRFNIIRNVKGKNIPLFIKIVCLYAHDFPGHILFNDNFNYVIKNADI